MMSSKKEESVCVKSLCLKQKGMATTLLQLQIITKNRSVAILMTSYENGSHTDSKEYKIQLYNKKGDRKLLTKMIHSK